MVKEERGGVFEVERRLRRGIAWASLMACC
jgi:hypothetical protein